MNDRDYVQLFAYFIGARGNHAIHVRALLHAGFVVEADPDTSKKSYVKVPNTNDILGVIVGEPDAIIGRYLPSITVTPAGEKVAGKKTQGSGV